jgi:hypothetical protein
MPLGAQVGLAALFVVAILNCESLLSKIAVIVEQLQEVSPLRGSTIVCCYPHFRLRYARLSCGLPSGRAYGALSIGISFIVGQEHVKGKSIVSIGTHSSLQEG